MVAQDSEDDNKLGLKKTLGLWHGVSVIFGSVVGSGIFISSNSVLRQSGSIGMTLIIWALCGVLVGMGSLMYVELGCAMPKAGGDYEYILCSLGSVPAFAFAWSRLVLIVPSAIAVAGISFGNYLLEPFFKCGVSQDVSILLGAMAITFFTFLNCWSLKAVNKIQLVFGIGKILALTFMVGAGVYALAIGRTDSFENAFQGTSSNVASIISAFYGCIFTFSGWNYLNFVIEELKSPAKNLPRAALIAISLIACLYIFLNVSYFALLSKSEVIASQAIAVDALQKLWSPLAIIVSICVSMSVFGFINSMLFTASRVVFSAARNHHLPVLLSYLHCHHNTPSASVMISGAVSLIFLALGSVESLLYMTAFSESIYYICSFVCFLILRYKQPDLVRPFKAPLWAACIFGVVFVFIAIAGIVQQPGSCLAALGIIVGGVIVYVIVKNVKPSKGARSNIDCVQKTIQKVLNSAAPAEMS